MSPLTLLLCSLVLFQCMHSSHVSLRDELTFKITCGSTRPAKEHYPFKVTKCPWMVSSLVQVEVEENLESFASFTKNRISELVAGFEFPYQSIASTDRDALGAMADQIDKVVTNARDDWGLLFSRNDGVGDYPPTSEEISGICMMCQAALDTIGSGIPVPDTVVKSAFERFMTWFLLPMTACWKGDNKMAYMPNRGYHLSQDSIVEFITSIRLLELSARTSTLRMFLFRTFHPELVVGSCPELSNPTWNKGFIPSLLIEDPSWDLDDAIKKMGDQTREASYESFDASRLQLYFKAADQSGATEWKLLEEIPLPIRLSPDDKCYPSIMQMKTELGHALLSTSTATKAKNYYPNIGETVSYPMKFPREIMVMIFGYFFMSDPNAELHRVCKWTRREFPFRLISDPNESLLRAAPHIMVPSRDLTQFMLASLAAIAFKHPASSDQRTAAIRKLGLFALVSFPRLLGNLRKTLNEYIKGERRFPEHLLEYSADLQRTGVLKEIGAILDPKMVRKMRLDLFTATGIQ